jgi:uncharacterized protein YbbC (DUF1343 family)
MIVKAQAVRRLKNTVLFMVFVGMSCANSGSKKTEANANASSKSPVVTPAPLKTGAENMEAYLPLILNKKVGIVANQTTIVNPGMVGLPGIEPVHLVDLLLSKNINVTKIYAPEHGFRGTADAGELIKDGKDTRTGLPIVSLYGDNKKPKLEHLKEIDVMIFDLQDVGARFYTYISTLHYVMEACAENNIPIIILDRPNPNGNLVDGPVLEIENKSFVGMHPIPVLHGMTIGEYGQMINGEKWLAKGVKCTLAVIPCLNYKRTMPYVLPVKPSPNLPNAQAINLYASLCFFEGTNVSVGRGTDKQFQVYGSPFLPAKGFSFIPRPNQGAKDPVHNGKTCFGQDLSQIKPVERLELKWLIDAYKSTAEPAKFFNNFFIKLAGTSQLQQQIEAGIPEDKIRETWQQGLESFSKMRGQYLIYL